MQEIHSTKATEKHFEYQWGGKMLFSHGTSNSTGVCICFRYNLEHKVIKLFLMLRGDTLLQICRYRAVHMFSLTVMHQTLKQDRLKHFKI